MKLVHRKIVKLMLLSLVLISAFTSLVPQIHLPFEISSFLGIVTSSIYYVSNALLTLEFSYCQSAFDKKARFILQEKRNAGVGDRLYFLDPYYVPPTEVLIPDHFQSQHNHDARKPVVSQFDPRFTFSIYFEWIRHNPGKSVPFHWSDWLNLSALNDFILRSKHLNEPCTHYFNTHEQSDKQHTVPLESYCRDAPGFPLGFKVNGFIGAHNRENAILLAKSYLFSGFAPPTRLVVLTNSQGAYVVEVENHDNDLSYALLHNGMPEQVLSTKHTRQLDVLKSYKTLLTAKASDAIPPMESPVIHLDEEWFDIDATKIISEMKHVPLPRHERSYLDSLEFSLSQDSPPKSLYEAEITWDDEDHLLGRHYDWRFFDGFDRKSDTQLAALHRLVRTYLKFCRTKGLVTWIAHGSLLSWYWNGLAFPWDLDADVQMPIRDLHRLAREFNQTLVLENVGHEITPHENDMQFNGMGAYFIDVGSSITHRNAGNGLNRIDARFIDIHTGLYVDITGLAVSDEIPSRVFATYPQNMTKEEIREMNKAKKLYNCRNTMWATLPQVSPLTKALVDNEIGYIPRDFKSFLLQEYQPTATTWPIDSGYEFVEDLRLWIDQRIIASYIEDPYHWVNEKSHLNELTVKHSNVSTQKTFPEQDAANLLYEDVILGEYLRTSEFTKFHELQMQYLRKKHTGLYFSNFDKYASRANMGRALYDDQFMKKLAKGHLDAEYDLNEH